MELGIQSNQEHEWSAVIIRADGRVQPLGIISGGTRWQKVVAFLKIKFINFKQWLR